ncbi:MAG: hypothetical protein Q9162_001243 [Coniocarpon cinnabarinum]
MTVGLSANLPVHPGNTTQDGFPQELPGWDGYVEWEKYPDRKRRAAEILKSKKSSFAGFPEFQMQPLPKTNPVLEGVRWKQYHDALGLSGLYKQSWESVLKEKTPEMTHLLQFPYNGESPRKTLVNEVITPNEEFFVRNHGGIPYIDKDAWFVDVEGLVKNPRRLTLADLQDESKFPRMSVVSTIQCSGTRRIEQINTYPGDGDELINAPWGEGAIGNARWTGVSLKKVIKHCGGLAEGGKHLEFFGADTYYKKMAMQNYVVSIPWRKVKIHEAMLAWEMNGQPLPRIHGYPVRIVVFGYIGARSVKWLTRIRAISSESRAPVQKKEYLHYSNQLSKYNNSFSAGISILDMPVSSAIMEPRDGTVIPHDGKIFLKGWAYSGKGFPVRVEVSFDGGVIWYEAEHLSKKYFHAWRIWETWVPVDPEGWIEVLVRCWDDALNTQPNFQRSAWNWDLHVTHSCHRIKLFSINKSREKTRRRLEAMEKAGEPLEPLTKPLEDLDIEGDEEFEANYAKQGYRDPEE